ncbi:hypothetical protein KSS87_023011 [Heliosperma pusillum]|nr:hypothetical protein KSS87_023011 [Heliosperma pusillum]
MTAMSKVGGGWTEPQAFHRFCTRHQASNINTKFKSNELKLAFLSTACAAQRKRFNKGMQKIGSINPSAKVLLESIPLSKWSLCHDGGHRYGIKTTNNSECFNGVLKRVRFLPITALVKATFFRINSYFVKHREDANKRYWLSVEAQPSDPVQRILFRVGLLHPPPMLAMDRKGRPHDTRPTDPMTGPSEHDELEAKYLQEKRALENKYQKLYEPLYTKRYEIVKGFVEVDGVSNKPADHGVDKLAEEKGVPDFWLTALKTNQLLADSIQEKDEKALKYLKDIKWYRFNVPNPDIKKNEATEGFKLEFIFDSNPYFKNSVLTKAYFMIDEVDPTLEKAIGTEIDWFPGKCLTEKVLKKKPEKGSKNAKPITKTETVDSFFNFFRPPKVPEDKEIEEEAMKELQPLMEQDYEIGSEIREKIIPHAVSWFIGEAALDDEDDEEDDDDEDDEDEDEDDEEDKDDDRANYHKKRMLLDRRVMCWGGRGGGGGGGGGGEGATGAVRGSEGGGVGEAEGAETGEAGETGEGVCRGEAGGVVWGVRVGEGGAVVCGGGGEAEGRMSWNQS